VRKESSAKESVICYQAVKMNKECGEKGRGKGGAWNVNKKRKAEWEDAEMDPEIRHLIETIWEVDRNPNLIGEITLHNNKSRTGLPPRIPPRKLQRVYKVEHLMSTTVNLSH